MIQSKWDKHLNKYSTSFWMRIETSNLSEESKLVFKTVGLFSIHALLFFIDSMKESKPELTGIKLKQWEYKLNRTEEKQIHSFIEEFTVEYFRDIIEYGPERVNGKHKEWLSIFESFVGNKSSEHLVDRVFPLLSLEDVARNEIPVKSFVEISGRTFERIDVTLEKNLEELRKRNITKATND